MKELLEIKIFSKDLIKGINTLNVPLIILKMNKGRT